MYPELKETGRTASAPAHSADGGLALRRILKVRCGVAATTGKQEVQVEREKRKLRRVAR